MGKPFAENPPIEFAASRLRELRRAALVIAAAPDPVSRQVAEQRRIAGRYHEWLMIAASLVEVEVPTSDTSKLSTEAVRQIEQSLTDAGWQLDG